MGMINFNPSHVWLKNCELSSTNKKVVDAHVDPPEINTAQDKATASRTRDVATSEISTP